MSEVALAPTDFDGGCVGTAITHIMVLFKTKRQLLTYLHKKWGKHKQAVFSVETV